MVSTRRKGLLAVVVLFAALLVGLFAAAQTAWAVTLSNGWVVDGAGTQEVKYRNDEAGKCDHLYIYDDNGNELDAFCLNRSLGMDDGADFSKRYLYDPASDTYTYTDKDGKRQTLNTPVLVGHFLANQGKPSSDAVLNWASDNANAIKYIKKALYYGYVGKKADLGVTGNDLYDVTQDAVWQIAHFGRGWENGSITSRTGGSDFTHGDLTAVDKLLKEYVFNNDIPEPDGQLVVGHGPNTATGQAQHVVSLEIGTTLKVYFRGNKTITGEGAPALSDEMFSFTISGPNIEDTTKVNYGNDVWFPVITFSETGEYTYTITEDQGDIENMTYASPITVKVTVEAEGDALVAKIDGNEIARSGGDAGEYPVNIVNKYGNTPDPKITNTTAKVNNTATSVELAAGDQGTFTDEVTFENLDADKTYTVVSTLMKDGEQFDQVTTNDVSGASLTVTFDKKITEAGKYSVKTELKDGDTVITHNGDLDVASETVNVTVKQPDSKVPTVATSASGTVEPAADQTITDTITLTNLIEGVKYTITGKLMDKEAQDVVAGATSDGPIEFTATADEAAAESVTKTMTFTFDASALAGKDVVVFETLTWEGDAHGDTNEVRHENYDDGGQTVTVGTSEGSSGDTEPPKPGGNGGGDTITTGKHPSLKTTVKVDGTAADAGKVLVVDGSAYQAIKLVDTIDYADLEAGESYTVRGTVMKFPGGTVVKTARATLTAAAASGTWELDFGVVPIEPDSYYVVYEYASDSTGKEVAKHENPTDVAQAVLVTVVDEDWPIIVENPGVVNDPVPVTGLEMATTVSINGKAASAEQARTVSYADASKVKNVTDTITYSGFEPGATYTIAGNLVDVAAGKVVATASVEQAASDTGDGTWTVEFTGVTLEPGKKYVVCEYAYDADNNLVAQHEDFSDLAQTIVVTAKPTASPAAGGKTTAKTADDMGGLVLGIAILALLSSGVVVYARRKAMR